MQRSGFPPGLEACRLRRFRRSTLALLLFWSGAAFGAQGEVEIVQDPIECWPVDQFLLIQSSFVPPEDIQTAKFYFRSTSHPDYYYVELTLGQSGGRAIAPKAQPDTVEVTFYTELVTGSFSAFRTGERTVPVASGAECKRRDPEAAFYTGQNPDIAVGATRLGSTPLPPGFQADGIARFLNATGIAGEAGGGGVSGKTIGIIAGVGGAGAAALALSGGGSSETTTTAIGGVTTTNVSSSSTSSAIGGGGSTTTTVGGGGSTSSTTTTVGGGSTTTTVVGGSTTTTGGSSSTTTTGGSSSTTTTAGSSSITTVGSSSTTTTVGSSSTTTTVGSSSTTTTVGSSSTTTTVASSSTTTTAPSTVDVTVSISDGGATPKVGTVFSYTVTVRNLGSGTANGVVVTISRSPAGALSFLGSSGATCSALGALVACNFPNVPGGQNRTAGVSFQAVQVGTVTVGASVSSSNEPLANQGNNTGTDSTQIVTTLRDARSEETDLTFQSSLALAPRDGSVRARIVVNDSGADETGSSAQIHTMKGLFGDNRMEAVLFNRDSHGSLRFDFSGTRDFVRGSLRVESGDVESINGTSLAFRVSPGMGPIRFTFALQDQSPARPRGR